MVFGRKLGAWFAIALLLSVPALACFDRTDLTPSEQECCQQMADQCGSMDMPDSHSCCTPTVRHDNDAAVVRINFAFALQIVRASVAEQIVTPEASSTETAMSWLLIGSPPESPPRAPTILRI